MLATDKGITSFCAQHTLEAYELFRGGQEFVVENLVMARGSALPFGSLAWDMHEARLTNTYVGWLVRFIYSIVLSSDWLVQLSTRSFRKGYS